MPPLIRAFIGFNMSRLARNGYFWLLVGLTALLGILIYVPSIIAESWPFPYEEWELTYLALQRPLFLIVVAIAAWRFGVRGGLFTFLTAALIATPHVLIDLIKTNWQPQLILDLVAIGTVGLIFIWLIDRQEKGKRLLEQAAAELGRSHDHLKVQVRLRTAELSRANEQLELDIAERKKAEAELEELYKREKELRRELEEQMKRRVEFTRALVHELKTPITIVQAANDLLREEAADETGKNLVKRIDSGLNKLSKRVDELLDLAKGEVGLLRLKYKLLEPLQLLQDLANDLVPMAVKQGKVLELYLPASLPKIRADEARLQEVLLNLSNNALKFTPKGGKITFRARVDDSSLVFEVQDTGRGIPKSSQKGIFTPYYHRDSDKENLGGLGLGLALSRMLVELHGGQMWVKSKKGSGSTFGFSLPLGTIGIEGEV